METVMTTNNGYDSILLVDEQDRVLSAWTATPEIITTYLRDGADANMWETGQFSGFDGEALAIADYGAECGRNGQIADKQRAAFWGGRAAAAPAAPITVFNDRELATVLHGLRVIQENANGPGDCVAGCCDHFEEADALNDTEIDALCERIQLAPTPAAPQTPAPHAFPTSFTPEQMDVIRGALTIAAVNCRLSTIEATEKGFRHTAGWQAVQLVRVERAHALAFGFDFPAAD